MFEVAEAAVEAALAAGARYADARAMHQRNESMAARNGDVEDLAQRESVGVGVRALVGSSLGLLRGAGPDRRRGAPGRRAGGRGRPGRRRRCPVRTSTLVPIEVRQDSWASPCEVDPLSVPLSEKGDLVAGVTATMRAAGADLAEALLPGLGHHASGSSPARGHRIDQRIRECGGGDERDRDRRRARPSAGRTRASAGSTAPAAGSWSASSTCPATPSRIADEAQALLTAPECPAGETTLILGSEQMALQIHESVGHAIELDRILGWEAAFAGTSWLDLAQLGSAAVRLRADDDHRGRDAARARSARFGYDDEGTPAAPQDIVRDGIWTGVLAGRDSASVAGLDYGGMVRADGWARLPMVRMTNVGLLPGRHSLEEMIAATDDGILMDTNRSWSIDDRRLNFQFGCEVGWEIKNGRRGRMLRNPTYTGISPRFWGSMDMLGNRSEWTFWGTPNCGKGQPAQVGHTGHPAVPARFRGIRVGVRG